MTILIANIGTSDLTIRVKINGSIEAEYLPIFEREEENIADRNLLNSAELKRWQDRNKIIAESLCTEELKVAVTPPN